MNNNKYFAQLYDYSIIRDRWDFGEDPSSMQYEYAPIRQIYFNTIKDLKKELSRHFDNNNFIITHIEHNQYEIMWNSSDESGYFKPTDNEIKLFQEGKRDIFNCVMQIMIYKIMPVMADELDGQLD
jgi:hypothetical protein